MNKLKLTLTDFFKSLYYGALVPALVEIQTLLENGLGSLNWSMLAKIAVGSVVAHLIRKVLEKPHTPIAVAKGDNNPPPIGGDPIKPPKN